MDFWGSNNTNSYNGYSSSRQQQIPAYSQGLQQVLQQQYNPTQNGYIPQKPNSLPQASSYNQFQSQPLPQQQSNYPYSQQYPRDYLTAPSLYGNSQQSGQYNSMPQQQQQSLSYQSAQQRKGNLALTGELALGRNSSNQPRMNQTGNGMIDPLQRQQQDSSYQFQSNAQKPPPSWQQQQQQPTWGQQNTLQRQIPQQYQSAQQFQSSLPPPPNSWQRAQQQSQSLPKQPQWQQQATQQDPGWKQQIQQQNQLKQQKQLQQQMPLQQRQQNGMNQEDPGSNLNQLRLLKQKMGFSEQKQNPFNRFDQETEDTSTTPTSINSYSNKYNSNNNKYNSNLDNNTYNSITDPSSYSYNNKNQGMPLSNGNEKMQSNYRKVFKLNDDEPNNQYESNPKGSSYNQQSNKNNNYQNNQNRNQEEINGRQNNQHSPVKNQYQDNYQDQYANSKPPQQPSSKLSGLNARMNNNNNNNNQQMNQQQYQQPKQSYNKNNANDIMEAPIIPKQQKVNQPGKYDLNKLEGAVENIEGELEECPEGCGRKFAGEALERHAKICKKVFQEKRKKFNTQKQRVDNSEQIKLLKQAEKEEKKPQGKNMGNNNANSKNKKAKWKLQSEQFRQILQSNKQGGGQPIAQEDQYDDRVQCSHCNRKFNELTLARHEPVCGNRALVAKAAGRKFAKK